MSNYTKATNFAAKDTLPVGDADKKVKGSEIDTEFNAISDAIATKADKNGPTFTGVPLAPTAAAGTNTTQIATTAFVQGEKASPAFTGTPTAPTATLGTDTTQLATTAFVQAALEAVYPVGSLYIATTSTDPSSSLGFGTWEAFGAGKVLVGQDTGDSSFNTLGETGGSKDAVNVSHTHSISDPGHQHDGTAYYRGEGADSSSDPSGNASTFYHENAGHTRSSSNSWIHAGVRTETDTTGISISSAGSSGTNKNLQPYVVVKMWKRTA